MPWGTRSPSRSNGARTGAGATSTSSTSDVAPATPPLLGQAPPLGAGPVAVPDLHLDTPRTGVSGDVETPVGLRVVVLAVGMVDPDLRGGVVAVPQLHLGAVGRAATGDVGALTQDVQRAARFDVGPLLRGRAVATPGLDRVAVAGSRVTVVEAQPVRVDDRLAGGRRGRR